MRSIEHSSIRSTDIKLINAVRERKLPSVWLSTDAAEASAMGNEMLARFAKLDIKALLK